MSRTFAVLAFFIAPIAAAAQTATDPVPTPPAIPQAAEQLPVDPASEAKPGDDPLGRIERRLDQIENRLERSSSGPIVVEQESVGQAATTTVDDNWRYRNYNGVWWYWLPSNRWVYWSDGAWVDFVPTTQPSTVFYGSAAPAYSYIPSYGSYGYVPSYSSYSYPRHYSSYGSYGYPSYGYGGYGGYGGGYYGGGYGGYGGGWGSAIGLGLSIGHAFSHNHHHHGGHGHSHGGHHSGHRGGHHHHHGGHHHH